MSTQTQDKELLLVSSALLRSFKTRRGGYTDLTIDILKRVLSGNGKRLIKKVKGLAKRKMLYLTSDDIERIHTDILRCDKAKTALINKSKNDNSIFGFFVYVMKAGIYYKIGMSTSPYKRLRAVQTGNANRVKMVKCYKFPTRLVMNTAESYFHSLFNSKRIKGEWFNLNDSDLLLMDKIIDLSSTGEVFVN